MVLAEPESLHPCKVKVKVDSADTEERKTVHIQCVCFGFSYVYELIEL